MVDAATVTVSAPDGEMDIYDATPDATAGGAVIVVQEVFGVNEHIQDVTRRFADAGWRAAAPHLFHRTGDPVLSYDDIQAVFPHMRALTVDALLDDIDATLSHLAGAGFPAHRVGIVGFCAGGSIAFLAAARRDLGAAVTFYGGGIREGRFLPPLLELAPELRAPWLGLYGDMDEGIPPEEVEDLRSVVNQQPVPTEVVRYPDADHGFHCDARPAHYDEGAARDAWTRTLSWFDRHLTV